MIVCLNGGAARYKKAAALYHSGVADHILLTASKKKHPLTGLGIPEAGITVEPDSRTTYQDARFTLPILTRRGTRSAMIVSDPFHLPRVRWTFRHVFEGSNIRLFFMPSEDASVPPDWWKEEKSRNIVFLEIIKNVYYRVYYSMLGLESEPVWILEWKAAVKRFFS